MGRYSQKLIRWYELHMVSKSIVAKSNEDLYPKSLEASMADKSVSPWAVVIRLLRSGRLLSVANQSSLPYSESYIIYDGIFQTRHMRRLRLWRACFLLGVRKSIDGRKSLFEKSADGFPLGVPAASLDRLGPRAIPRDSSNHASGRT